MTRRVRLEHYRKFVYGKGCLSVSVGEEERIAEISRLDRFRYRTRYFSDSGIIGSKTFVAALYQRFKGHFSSKNEKRPKSIQGLRGVYSLKRLSEGI